MQTSPPPGKDLHAPSVAGRPDKNILDIRFISDLGRSLLFTVHPKKVAVRVAEALRERTHAVTCVFVAELESIGLISCGIGPSGVIRSDYLHRSQLEKWLTFMPPQAAYAEHDSSQFLISEAGHSVE